MGGTRTKGGPGRAENSKKHGTIGYFPLHAAPSYYILLTCHFCLRLLYNSLMTKHTRKRGTGTVRKDGHIAHFRRGKIVFEHIEIAERVLGRPLPPGAQVHHVDGNPANNAYSNLVICPSQSYHRLLHTRMRAKAACGNPDWRHCTHCKQYDDPANLAYNDGAYRHRWCAAAYKKERRRQLKESTWI